MNARLWADPNALGPMTDLYELTMMAGYAGEGLADTPATFDLFVRKLPRNRSYLVASGIEPALEDLLALRFVEEQIAYLRSLPVFRHVDPAWFDRLEALRFQGDVWAVPEGTIVFEGEPILRVDAPLEQAQWVETYLISAIGYPTLVASKAARIIEAAKSRRVVEFGARRGHGPSAGLLAARAACAVGFSGTSLVEAARLLGVPAVGTMAHAWVQTFADEPEAFRAFIRHFPERATLLVDTYDTPEGVRRACQLAEPFAAIRIDSGDLAEEAKRARAILDDAGRSDVRIFASGDLNESKIAALLEAGAPIDAFGVGTELITSRDDPSIAMVYKLVAVDGQGRLKLSPGKATYPGAKQIDRLRGSDGRFERDVVRLADEPFQGEPLLRRVIQAGRRLEPPETLETIRERFERQRAALPEALRGLDAQATYPVTISDRLQAEADRIRREEPGAAST